MEHETAIAAIGEIVRGQPFDGHEVVLEHLESCPECQALSETYLALVGGYAALAGESEGHPTPAEIVDFGLRPTEVPDGERRRIAAHVESCVPCRAEVQTTREAETRIAHAARSGRSGADRIAILAASLLLAALAYPAYLGLVRAPRTERTLLARIDSLSESLERESDMLRGYRAWSGTVELPLFRSPLRDREVSVPIVSIAERQPVVALAVVPEVGDSGADPRPLRIAISDPAGRIVWSRELGADEVRNSARLSGVLTLLLPATTLVDGRHHVVVSTIDGKDVEFEVPFDVARRAPDRSR